MTAKRLPTKLGKEPLIDVVCGASFDSDISAETLLPGMLLSKLSGKQPKFETLPASQLPQIVRDSDPNLQNAPLMRVVIDEQFSVLIASKWLGVGCQMPYAGWPAYKQMITEIFAVLGDAPFVESINRHSLKYVNLLKDQDVNARLSWFNLHLEIAGRKLSNQATRLRTEISELSFLHAATIISPAMAQQPNGMIDTGTVVDVDTHRIETMKVQYFLQNLPTLLDAIHAANKEFFFDLLSKAGLEELEPTYD